MIFNSAVFFSEGKVFKALYNSEITFQQRLYASLDVDMTRVRLHQPLEDIVKLPLLYVRDMVPRACFEAVLRLHEVNIAVTISRQ